MNKRKIALFAMATMSLAALASCGEPGNIDPSASEDPTSESSSVASESSSASTGKRRAEMELTHSSIRAGMTLIDGAVPSTTYIKTDGSSEDMGTRGDFTITPESGEKTYGGDEPLPAGRYTVKNRLLVDGGRTITATAELTVTEGNIDKEDASGNVKGVSKATTLEDLADYKYMNYPGIDTLGTQEKASGCMPSVGNPQVLVIPVVFKNTSFGTTPEKNELAREILREAFFAKNDKTAPAGIDGTIPDTTPWESLASYYDKASNGALEIGGEVTPIFEYQKNDTDPGVASSGLAQTICSAAVSYFKNPANESGWVLDPKKFDSDGDGFIDGVEIIYVTSQPTPSQDGGNSVWWNYTTNVSTSPSVDSPNPRRLFFSRWDFLTNGYYTGSEYTAYGSRWDGKAVDAHTIIHETGHMMGAPDYYSYSANKGEGPAGCVDMMDQNVGDHNAYTKMAYGWVAPWVVDYSSDDFEITLPSYTETKNFLIVPAKGKAWNGTPWDEYLMLEYYTPTGVNAEDSDGYPEWQQASSSGDNAYGHGGTYRRPGLQMFHVDTRAASQKGEIVDGKDVNVVRNYTDTPKKTRTVSADGKTFETGAFGVHSNTPNGSTDDGRPGSVDGATGKTSPFREMQAIFPGTENSTAGTSYYSTMGCMVNLFGLQEYYEKDGDGDGEPDETYGAKPDAKYGGSFYSPSHHQNWYTNGTKFNNGLDFPWTIEIVAQDDTSVTLHFVNNHAVA